MQRRHGLLALLFAAPPAKAVEESPYSGRLELGLSERGRIRPSPSNYNCVSTSSLDESHASSWTAPSNESTTEVCELIKDYVLKEGRDRKQAGPVLVVDRLVSDSEPERGRFLSFDVPGTFKGEPDHLEFLIKRTDPVEWEGETDGLSVFFRSSAGGVQWVYPFQTPVSDFGKQRKRMEELRQELGFVLRGCELLECYQ